MVENLKQWISEVTRLDRLFAGDEVDLNTQMAIAMLLAMAANSDGSIDNAELQAMVAALTRRYQLSSIVALDLLTRAIEDLSSGHADPNLFAELRKKLNTAQKEDCLVMILDVIAAPVPGRFSTR
jgi:uncharacterized tellurite resistance protein B-like protein